MAISRWPKTWDENEGVYITNWAWPVCGKLKACQCLHCICNSRHRQQRAWKLLNGFFKEWHWRLNWSGSEMFVISWLLKGMLAYANQQRAIWCFDYLYLPVNRTTSKECVLISFACRTEIPFGISRRRRSVFQNTRSGAKQNFGVLC